MKNSIDLRSEILLSAYQLLFRYDFRDITVALLEKAIGRSRGSIFYYFRDKNDLFIEVYNTHFFPLFINHADNSTHAGSLEDSIQFIKSIDVGLNPYKTLLHLFFEGEKFYPGFNCKIKEIFADSGLMNNKTNSNLPEFFFNYLSEFFIE